MKIITEWKNAGIMGFSKILFVIAIACIILVCMPAVSADNTQDIQDSASVTYTKVDVSDFDGLVSAIENNTSVEITLTNSFESTDQFDITSDKTVIINLNGKTITLNPSSSGRLFENYGNLTINGVEGSIETSTTYAYGTVNNYGTLIVNGGTYTNLKDSNASNFYNRSGGIATFNNVTIHGGGGCIASEVNTTTYINGGYYENDTYPAIENRGDMFITAGEFINTSCSSCDGRYGYTIRSGESSELAYLQIKGESDNSVKVTGVQGGLAVIGGTSDIYNGQYETVACTDHTSGGSSYYAGYFTGESYVTSTNIYGGTFESFSKTAILVGNGNPPPDSGAGESSTVMIFGGTFVGGDAEKTSVSVNNQNYAIGGAYITGGTFSSNVETYVANYAIQTEKEGMYSVSLRTYGVASVGDRYYGSLNDAFIDCPDYGTITILDTIKNQSKIILNDNRHITLNLNVFDIGFSKLCNISIFQGSLNIVGSGTIYEEEPWLAPIILYGSEDDVKGYTVINVGKDVTLRGWAGLFIDQHDDHGSKAFGIEATVYGTLKSVKDTSGAGGHALYINGTISSTEGNVPKIVLDGATLETELGNGIYLAGYADTTVINSTIISEGEDSTGIEIRAGKLAISGDTTVKGGIGETSIKPNGNGSTTANVAIAIVQHTTKLPLKVEIRGGTFSATTALFEQNAQNNDDVAISKISINIIDGKFESTKNSEYTVYSENVTGFISGGLFTLDPETKYIKSGYKSIGGQVQAANPVATIGDRGFATLQDAFEYAQNGDTISLKSTIEQEDGILFDKSDCSITLDLNGKTLNVKEGANVNNRAIKIESGTLTVVDSSSGKTGKIIASGTGTTSSDGSGAYGAFRIEADGKLIANHITLENSRPWGLNVKVCGGKAYLTGVTIISSYGGGIEVTEADLGTHSKTGYAELVDCNFVQKGYFDHCSSAVSVSGGSAVTVKGGSYTSEGVAVYVFSSGGYITVEDGYFSGDREAIRAEIDTSTYPEYVGGVIIEGGEFEGKFSIASPATLAISGGTFDNDPSDYVSNGYHAFESTDGTDTVWTVEKIAATSGDKIYATIQDAINDTGTGTITLADDSAESLTVTGTATISANGYDITGTITVSGTLTLTGTGSVSSVVLSSTSAKLVSGGPTVTSVTDSVSNYHVVSSTIDGVTTYSLARTSSGGGGTVTPPVNPPVTPDEPETDVEEHPDGSTTETTTNTTTNPDGSKTESTTVTEKDPEGNVTGSTVTETTTSEKEEDGVKETVTSTTVTTNDAEGNKTGSTSTSTTTTVTDSTTTVTEKEEVKDADDKVTSSTEKVTETTKIDGGTVTSETTEAKDAAGNVTSSTETVRAESDDGNVRTEAVTESGTTTVNTTVSVSASGQVDDSLIQQAVAQSDAVSEKVSAEAPDRVIQIWTGSDTDITLSPESMSAIADTGAEFRVICETGSMQLDRDVVGTLTEPGEDVTVRMAESDDSDLTEAQQSAKGDRFGVTLTATVGTDRYHLLGGTVTVTIPYTDSMGADPASLGVFYIDEDGVRTFMESVYDQALKSFVFQTDHFSLFVVDDLPASSADDDDDTMLYAGMAAVIVVVIVVAAAVILHRKH